MAELIAPEHRSLVLKLVGSLFPQAEVWAFGSRIAGTAGPYSDLDIALKQAEPLDSRARRNLLERLSASDIPFKVDVADYQNIEPEFRDLIDRTAVRW